MSASYKAPNLLAAVTSATDFSKVSDTNPGTGIYRFVKQNTTDNQVILCPADNAPVGILQNQPKVGQAAEVAIPGGGALLHLGGTVTNGDYLKPDASGNGVLANPGEFAGAIAMSDGVADDVIQVLPCWIPVPSVVVSVYMPDISTASTAYAVSPVAGRVVEVQVVTQAAITTADSALTAKVGATGMTGGAFTLPVAGAAAGQIATAAPTALNVVAKDGLLALSTDGASSGVAPAQINFVIVPKNA